jgi:hypothetical protein
MTGAFSRREVMRLGAAASSLAAIPGMAFGMAARQDAPRFGRAALAVVEQGLIAAPALSLALQHFGVPVRAVGRDVTALWADDLSVRWRNADTRTAIAGLTSPHALLCLEQLGHLAEMRVVWRQVAVDAPGWAHSVAEVWAGRPVEMASTGLTRTILNAGQLAGDGAIAWVMAPRVLKDRL